MKIKGMRLPDQQYDILDNLRPKACARSSYPILSDCESRETVVPLRVRWLLVAQSGIDSEHLHRRTHDYAARRVSHRAFEFGSIDLGKGGVRDRNYKCNSQRKRE